MAKKKPKNKFAKAEKQAAKKVAPRDPRMYDWYDCTGCAAHAGELHDGDCEYEMCALCGYQLLGENCDCVFILNGTTADEYLKAHPGQKAVTDAVMETYWAAVDEVGGRLPWPGEYPGKTEGREFGWFCTWGPGGDGKPCAPDAGSATLEVIVDLNRVYAEAVWSRELRRWMLPGTVLGAKPTGQVPGMRTRP